MRLERPAARSRASTRARQGSRRDARSTRSRTGRTRATWHSRPSPRLEPAACSRSAVDRASCAERIARELGADVVAVDQSPSGWSSWRASGAWRRSVGDVQELPFDDESFDCASPRGCCTTCRRRPRALARSRACSARRPPRRRRRTASEHLAELRGPSAGVDMRGRLRVQRRERRASSCAGTSRASSGTTSAARSTFADARRGPALHRRSMRHLRGERVERARSSRARSARRARCRSSSRRR